MQSLLLLFAALPLLAQLQPQITCDATAEPLQIRSEGLTELSGIIALNCAGPANLTVAGSINIVMSSAVTNKVSSTDNIDVLFTLETPTGLVPISTSALLISRNNLIIPSFTFNMPANGQAILRISNIRVASNLAAERQQVTAFLSTSGLTGIGIRNNPVVVAVAFRGLYANSSTTRIFCQGATVPEDITFADLVASNAGRASIRATEGSPAAFERRPANATNGVRLLVRYSGLPANARIFVPDVIAGSTAITPTAIGDLGYVTSGGAYIPNPDGSLLLSIVPNADNTGSGDGPRLNPITINQPTQFNNVTELRTQNGNAYAVFEVVDANPRAIESAQIPTFVFLPPNSPTGVVTAQLSFAPLSTIASAATTAPILRFTDAIPPIDCSIVRDCNARYFPRLLLDFPALTFTVPQGKSGFYQKYIRVINDNGGVMVWNATISYQNGSNWLSMFPSSGVNNNSIILSFLPDKLTRGTYNATLTVDAGPVAGVRTVPVTLTITDPQPDVPAVTAFPSFVPGSLATITGKFLIGDSIRVTLDSLEAKVISRNATATSDSLTVLTPLELGTRPNAQLQIIRDGIANNPQTVTIYAAAPSINQPNGIVNQDGAVNNQATPELTGNYFQIFATGLPDPSLGKITARIHDREIDLPAYAGPAPSQPGVQQVNFQIPADLPTMSTEIRLCGAPLLNPTLRTCSKPVLAWIQRPPDDQQ